MSVKDNFTPEQWKNLLKAPMLAAYAVAGAAPSKQEDFVREMAAVAEGVFEGEHRSGKDSLLGAVVADIYAQAEDDQRGETEKLSLDEVKARALAACRAVAAALQDTKVSPEEAYEYKRWVLVVAEKVAAAAKEGGLFGFGGEHISGNEVATINELGEAIGI